MKFSTSRENLFGALQVVGRAVSTRSTMPSLAGVLIDAADGRVALRGTDMEIGLSGELEASVEKPGVQLLPGRLLVDIVRSLPEGEVSLVERSEQRDVEVSAGAGRFHLRTLPVEDFPNLPSIGESPVELPLEPLIAAIERVARAASRDEVRPILTGVLVSVADGELTMVATDSYRLAVQRAPIEAKISEPLEAIVPARALRELSRLAPGVGQGSVDVSMDRNQIVFGLGGMLLSSRLIDGQFPNYRQLLPDSFEHEVRLPRTELLEIARRVSQLAQKNSPLRLQFAEDEVTVVAETADVGDAREAMPASYEGEPLEIAFNPQFLIEGIDSVGGDEVVLQLTSPLRPGLLRPAGEDDFRYLVMPIRLNV